MAISFKDRERLRALAAQHYELSQSDAMKQLWADWEAHGAMAANSRPMIRIETGPIMNDYLPTVMQCEGEEARRLERQLILLSLNYRLYHDDTLVPDHFPIRLQDTIVPFGLPVIKEQKEGYVGHHFVPYLHDLEEDYHLLKDTIVHVNQDKRQQLFAEANDVFGDILPVRYKGECLRAELTQHIVHIMAMEDMYMSMYDYPELFLEMMDRLAEDFLRYHRMIRDEGGLLPTATDEHLNQGSYCFTPDLPKEGPVDLKDVWLFMDSQETVSISPAMYKELVLPAYKKVAAEFGLLSYGCCEPTHAIWDGGLETIPNLRKVSISAWCDEDAMGERLRGKHITYLRKPSPNLLGLGPGLDEDAVLAHFRKTVEAARGCVLEFAQRDVVKIYDGPEKVARYVALARQCMEQHVR